MLLYGTVAALISSKREAIKLSLEHSFKSATHHTHASCAKERLC